MPNFELVPDRNGFSGFPGSDLMRAFLDTIKARPLRCSLTATPVWL